MTGILSKAWPERATALTEELTEKGKIRSPQWQEAFRSTPRHVLVPTFYSQDNSLQWQKHQATSPEGLDAVYSNTALFTDVDDEGRGVSSSSMPGLMARMLEMLDTVPGHRVLEIGTGTGYNTALLCSVLGDDHVFSMDVDYVAAAQERLRELSYAPTVVNGDGINGMPQHAPFDRVLSTVAVDHIPWAWVDQLAEGGVILTDIKLNNNAGNLVRLIKCGGYAEGRFDTGYASFMSMRHPTRPAPSATPPVDGPVNQGRTRLPPTAWDQTVPWFLASLELPVQVSVGFRLGEDRQPIASRLTGRDGSWCEVAIGDPAATDRYVVQAGPNRLWIAVELAFRYWEALDRPGWDRLGMTVTQDEQWVWVDEPSSEHRWSVRTDNDT